MKKLLIFLAMMLPISTSFADGDEPTPLPIKPINPEGQHDPFAKSPILIPEVYLNGNVLTFDDALEGCMVQLLDEEDVVVFTDFIEENQVSVIFPTTLSGTYELQIVMGSITFYCEIEL